MGPNHMAPGDHALRTRNPDMNAPHRVVVLTSGPALGNGVREFIRQLELHPEIELGAVIWQTRSTDLRGIVADLWRRRRWLAGPLLVKKYLGLLAGFLLRPVHTVRLARTIRALRDRIICFGDIHSPQALARVRECHPRLLLVYGAPIIRRSLFEMAPLGTLGIHHGKVPEYRGKKTMFWAIFNSEPTAGVTIQRINETLDGGDVVASGEVAVGQRLPWLVWRDLERLGMRLYLRAILDVCSGRAVFREQPGVMTNPYRDPAAGDIMMFWLRYLNRLAAAVLPGTGARRPGG
jgi:Formyl transferase